MFIFTLSSIEYFLLKVNGMYDEVISLCEKKMLTI